MISTLLAKIRAARFQSRLRQLQREGLQMADDCRLMDMPMFGSEPYLISIGRHVTISSRVTFLTHDGSTWIFREQDPYRDVVKYGRITIHENCFLGWGVTLMPGVSVGPNSIVGAGSVVTRDVPPDSVVAGVPAKLLCGVEEFADRLLKQTPAYNKTEYHKDKRRELLRLFPYPW